MAMFNRARITLTLLYSGVFLACFWAFSFGLFFWMEESFEIEISELMTQPPSAVGMRADLDEIVKDFNEVALDQLSFVLIMLNLLLLGIIPLLSWFLTGQALEPVRRAHEVQRQFVSDAAHELRTPLTITRGGIEIALKKKRPAEEYRAVLASSAQEIRRLSELTEHLLLLTRHDDKQERLLFKSVDLADLVSTVLAAHRMPFTEKNLSIKFNPPDESVTVSGDPLMLSRLFANLIDNAIKYSPRGGRMAVSIREQEKKVLVEIADTGIGIAPELHENIFGRFTRADASRGETKGFGLGLAICRAIAENHGGSITVASVPGQGSTFTVTLPRI
jgi:two-component system, OmpR family, Ni(II)-sensor and/or redox sensor kinase NrsS